MAISRLLQGATENAGQENDGPNEIAVLVNIEACK